MRHFFTFSKNAVRMGKTFFPEPRRCLSILITLGALAVQYIYEAAVTS